ncbi:MchC protein [Klebsiella spallanzanii]|uniref:MchC protein n=1 Tax=Klebsiella spallanzanii TaxID=2587528 RepID=UPI00259612BF|nr:MchC protein [Klebsiella spallanzanii]MDM4208958.1 MchC protein [Klebsiella spallanzanii]
MKYSLSLSDLTVNLIPFTARRVDSILIWCAPEISDRETLQNNCSYLVDPDSSAHAKIFQAERYGGSGLQRNGGGARCGFDGLNQIKGIGANLLVGEGSDRHHSNGALDVNDAIYEALWGEVLADVLPYGAVRARAVLLTNSFIQNSRIPLRRALLVREPVIRPAHFERAPYFRPQFEYIGQLMHDARRVKAVIPMLPGCLPIPFEGFSVEAQCNPQLYCIEGLCELARRQAWQMAFCRTRFLRLTTSPSNIATDGRLLDFNGLRCLFPGDYRDNFDHRLRVVQMMKEPWVLQQGLSDLCLYLGKYLFDSSFTLIARQHVENTFRDTFQEACYRGYLELLGIPTENLQLGRIPELLKQLVNSFITLLEKRSETLYCPQRIEGEESQLQVLVMSLIHLSQRQFIPDDSDIEHDVYFLEALRHFTDTIYWLAEIQGDDISRIMQGVEQRARKRLQPRDILGKVRMSDEISGILDTYGNDALSLQQAFTEMGSRMQLFAREALGRQLYIPR